ncbi:MULTISPECIES: sodium-extruding oxaloacetate decarboxylase subunit alpha [Stutzerimonas]|jgi:pyruvate carboxylase subunit B|uniref:sodium-extruding oxaloacetate decarboxylase subunit alpha n=1 Tax=Stutzerimonas TaxID=2901164 RepID=UPI000315D53F|nr:MULTISPECIES: sodium-extruding oxaloacetate decarboxylase subunit alpha [Stutzerimonas]EPL61092.1 pyruvate carboxylase subunit B [Stutzerimonas stutzeri B1SMN1]MBW8335902.1 sodium-extruding oxaloacetate decarboxylase subunit alpha [Pseudomonas sp.]MCJ0876912.1 sodium-extruding oxaloacetate decarboxylase subunit alpha [Pseudomonas sp. JI-2]NMY64502.1 sodium-extruding oxaloacetate decarboxylase subunit alpha [Pseudomonas sp. WS 5018]AKN25195.1 pyruvate carboxylase subunit B [Stutzerimonas stu
MTAQKKITVTDTILRDAHQSLLATRMRTEDMLPICDKLDRVGYWSLEVWGGATFDACVRFLKEDPWERLRQLKAALPNTRLQMLLRGQNLLGYRHYSDDVVEAFCARAAENGIDVFRIFDAMNDVRNLETAIRAVKKSGKHAQGTIAYTTSPVHTVELFVEQARAMRDMGVDSIAIKDMAGLLTPFATGDLVRALKAEIDLPVFIHSHDTAGVASMCQLKAIENGADHIDTAISSMAWGTSHPGTESMVAALKGTPYDTGLDLELLQEIGLYFYAVRKKYHQFESEFTGVDTRVQVNQVPGGMISNLANQLKEQGALHRMDEVLAEIPKVRKDLGYPPLVTPTSQIVGTQAFFNVLAGERYKTITTEVKYYLQGRYGKAPAPVCEHLRFQAIGSEEVIECRPADLLAPELDKLRKDIGELAKSEEDVLTFAMFPDIGRKFLEEREAGTLQPEVLLPIPDGKAAAASVEGTPTEFVIDVHGETYRVDITGVGVKGEGKRHFYLSIDGMPEEVVFEPLNAFVGGGGSQRKQASAPGDVSTTMPGNVVDVLVAVGDVVKAGQTVLVSEAMKMETEIQAPIAGTVKAVHVAKGDRVNPGEVLIEIEG